MILEPPSSYNNISMNYNTNSNNRTNANDNINNNLLKTSNFNIGDYIHSISSPSPNVNLTSITNERNIINLKGNSMSNSLTQVALLSTSGISNDNVSTTITDSIDNRSRSNNGNQIDKSH